MYHEIKKQAAIVPTDGGDGEATPTGKKRGAKAGGNANDAVTTAKKRGKAGEGGDEGTLTTGKKRGRKQKIKTPVEDDDEEEAANDSEEEGLKNNKKIKLEAAEEGGGRWTRELNRLMGRRLRSIIASAVSMDFTVRLLQCIP